MNKKLVVILCLLALLLLSSLLFVRANSVKVKASNGYPVHNLDTGLNYTTIQGAIDAPETLDGHTIFVEEGTYYEHVVVNKSLTLIGENGRSTIIDGNGTGTVVQTTVDNVNISMFTLQNGFWGIELDGSNNIVSDNNVVSNERVGILLGGSNTTLRNNNITSSQLNLYLHSWAADKEFNQDIDSSNTVNGKPIYYLVNQHNQQIPQDAGYVAAVNCTKITARNLNLEKNIHGIFFVNTNQSTIEDVTVLDTPYGIFLRDSNNTTIYNNRMSGSLEMEWGIWIWGFDNNVSFNTFEVEYGAGVFMDQGSKNMVSNNIFEYCSGGIRVHSENTIIYNNRFTFNDVYGILAWDCSNNSISENNIIASNQGIILWGGESLDNIIFRNNISYNDYGIVLSESLNNTLYHNNFIDNTQQVYIMSSGANFWDDGIEGNFWSNYTGVDSDNDGIGDTEHIIDVNNIDRCPLMGMFHRFNTSLEKNVNVVSNSTIEDFEYFESNSTIKMDVSGEEGFGFCRVSIPHVLMNVSSMSVIIDDGMTPVLYPNYTLYDNGTHRWIYFAYEHSTLEIVIVPEFPSFLILPLFMIATLLAVVVYRKRPKMSKE